MKNYTDTTYEDNTPEDQPIFLDLNVINSLALCAGYGPQLASKIYVRGAGIPPNVQATELLLGIVETR